MEDVEYFKSLIKKCKECNLKECISCDYTYTDIIKLENIINRLEYLEKENAELKESHDYIYEAYQDAGKKMFDYQEQLEKENEFWKEYKEKLDKLDSKDFIFKHELENYIPKSVIEEKIEFYKRYGKVKNSDEYVMSVEIEVLKELLGEEK